MSRASLLAIFAALGAGCSLVIGTSTKTLSLDGGDDATITPEAGDDASGNDAGPSDGGPDSAPCSNTGCLAEAGVCGTNCGVQSASCQQACKTQTCKNQCVSAESACRSSCAANCDACTLGAGCPDQSACNDASAM